MTSEEETGSEPWSHNSCPYRTYPTECELPSFATGFHVCGSDQTEVICFNFMNKLVLSIAMDRSLAEVLIKHLQEHLKEKEEEDKHK